MHSSPLVSILIPVFNQVPFIFESLNSVLQQTYSNFEVLIVDDGSTDGTASICQEFCQKDSRFQYLYQTNKGPSAARNRGIAASHGEYLCLLDGDDRMDLQRIAVQLKVLTENPTLDIVYTALLLIDSNGSTIGEMHGQEINPENFLATLLFRNVIPGPSTIMAKRECLTSHPYHEHFVHAEDYELMIRLAHFYRFQYINLPLTYYRRHLNNLSNHLKAHRQAELKVIQQYTQSKIEAIVDQTSFPRDEKTLLKGKILFNQERCPQALIYFQQLNDSFSRFYEGNCFVKLQDRKSAKSAYEQALLLDTTNAACYNNLGNIFAQGQQWQDARFCWEKALSLKPGYLDAKENLNHFKQSFEWRYTWRELRRDLLVYH
ncbi:glycosyltransferase [Candidatus Protochlamydia sp. W-9]|uniref:glycosyltransferase n=1 Tax=Candidatus Protochlamydia sp. W-9 TaxID=1785087 RepID=UPI00096A9C1A|nr:glycosyltransferase [Candidatus Protochlamydia sp. W-9]